MARLSEIDAEWKERTLFLIKFSTKERLEFLQAGNLFMNNFQFFIDLEKKSGTKGQGDNLEGTAVVNTLEMTMINPETGEVILEKIPVGKMTLRPDVLLDKPVFCATSLDGTLLEVTEENEESFKAKMVFTEEQKERFVNDFGATHALIIPYNEFAQRIDAYFAENNMDFAEKKVMYDDFIVNHSKRLQSFVEPNTDAFFWKDQALKYQNEYRLVVLEEVEAPYIPNIGDLSEVSTLMTTEQLFSGQLELRFTKRK